MYFDQSVMKFCQGKRRIEIKPKSKRLYLDMQKCCFNMVWHRKVKLEINKIFSATNSACKEDCVNMVPHFALSTHTALAYTLCILTECSPMEHITSLVCTQEDHLTLFMLSILCSMYYSFCSCFSSCLLACSLFIATRCIFQGFSSFEWWPEFRIAAAKKHLLQLLNTRYQPILKYILKSKFLGVQRLS